MYAVSLCHAFQRFGCSGSRSQRITEDRVEEHVRFTGVDGIDLHTHLPHDLHAIAETEDDTFLLCTHDVSTGVFIEV